MTLGNKLTEIIIKPWYEIHLKENPTETNMKIVVKMYFHRRKQDKKKSKFEKERNLYFELSISENGETYSIDDRSSGFQ